MDVEHIIFRLGADATDFTRVIGTVETRLIGLSQRMASMAAGGGLAGAILGTVVGTGLLAAIESVTIPVRMISSVMGDVVSATLDAAKAAVVLGAEYEQAAAAFRVMAGDAQTGMQMLEDINELAVRTPYRSRELVKVSQMLMAMGVDTESVLPVLERLGDVAAGNSLRLERLALAYGQVTAAGRLLGTELRQFTEAGVGVKDFAAALGVSTVEFRAMMQAGQVSSSVLQKTFNQITGETGRFANLSTVMNRTVLGQWEAIGERMEVVGRKVAMSFFEKFDVGGKLGEVNKWLSQLDVGMITDKLVQGAGAVVDYGQKFIGWLEKASILLVPVTAAIITVGQEFLKVGREVTGDVSWDVAAQKATSWSMDAVRGIADVIKHVRILALEIRIMYAQLNNAFDWGIDEEIQGVLDMFGEYGRILGLNKNEPLSDILEKRKTDPKYRGDKPAESSDPAIRAMQQQLETLKASDPGAESVRRMGRNMAGIFKVIDDVTAELDEMHKRVVLGIDTAKTRPDIPDRPTMSAEAQRLQADTMKALKEGIGPLEQMGKQFSLIEEAGLTGRTRDLAIMRMFDEAGKGVKPIEVKFPPAAFKGTAEAVDAVNRTMTTQADYYQQYLDRLNAMVDKQEEVRKEMEGARKAFEDFQAKGGNIMVKDLR